MNTLSSVLWFTASAGHVVAMRRPFFAEGVPRRAKGATS